MKIDGVTIGRTNAASFAVLVLGSCIVGAFDYSLFEFVGLFVALSGAIIYGASNIRVQGYRENNGHE